MDDKEEFRLAWENSVVTPDFYQQHAACPECHGAEGELGVTTGGPLAGRDLNNAFCACGWKGRVYQLVPAEVKQDG